MLLQFCPFALSPTYNLIIMKFNRKKRNKAQKANEKAYVAVPEGAQKVGGQTLAERLTLSGALPEADVLPILSQLLRELQTLHAAGTFHLGLCPEGVLVGKDGSVSLTEADVDKWKPSAGVDTEMLHSRPSGYEAPELLAHRMESVGPWSDFYALGATLYRLLTFSKVPEFAMIIDEGEDAFEFPEGVSDRMRTLILHLMKPNRRQRPQSIDELKDWILPEAEPAAEEAPAEEPAAEEAPAEAPAAEEPAAEEAPAEEPATEEAPAEEPAAEEAPAEEPAAEEAPADEPAAEEAPAEEPATEEAPAAEPATEEETDEPEEETDDEDESHWYNLDREDLLTLLFVVGFTAVLLLCKAFV